MHLMCWLEIWSLYNLYFGFFAEDVIHCYKFFAFLHYDHFRQNASIHI